MTVRLPPSVKHGTANAYGHYKCRCDPCRKWRRDYDRPRTRDQVVWQRTRRAACRSYVWSKGLRFYGSGPFSRNPIRLAVVLSQYLGDDLTAYINDYARREARNKR